MKHITAIIFNFHLAIIWITFIICAQNSLPRYIYGHTHFASEVREKPLPLVALGPEGNLVYVYDKYGNRIPDFSHCGYMGGNEPIPNVPIWITVSPIPGDNTQRIQKALDYVASLPADTNDIRGAVLLQKGQYKISGGLKISTSGVVLRGQGMSEDGTVLVAAGQDRRTLIKIAGVQNRINSLRKTCPIKNNIIPVGAYRIRLNSSEGLKVGDTINIVRPCTKEWIDRLGMNSFGGGLRGYFAWKPRSRDLIWDRVIKSIHDDTVIVDAPVTTAIETQFGGGWVEPYSWPGRIRHVGVENLRCVSTFDTANPKDEAHSWMAVTMENVENAWMRQVTMKHFAGSAVALWESCKWITVQDCLSLAPVSELGGYRRHTFFTMGQLTLFLRCISENGRHGFSVGYCAAGPNAFVQCQAISAHKESGPIDSWASGTLYDMVRIDGNALSLANRDSRGEGIGWSAANSVFWQCSAAIIRCENPPTAYNWAYGCWGEFEGNGIWTESNSFVKPLSLYQAQLKDRLGPRFSDKLQIMPFSTSSTTRPTVQQAEEWTNVSHKLALQLMDYLSDASQRDPIPVHPVDVISVDQITSASSLQNSKKVNFITTKKLSIENGIITNNGHMIVGGTLNNVWWRGSVRPQKAPTFGAALTRFVPGRAGPGFTDDLEALTNNMLNDQQAVLEHNYGLWYDRRRDDHQRVRRMNGAVRPPFYEQPFARSGHGLAWDGLSKYDLTKYNPWYWNRLKEFADFSDRKGLVLLHQNYFQHNILEAGAHWADFPWRSANNINHTDFPEPPPYAGNKRIFMDELFYDVTHPVRRKLHQAYIRKCLDNFSDNTNVIQFTSAEYTGPLYFVQFWLDTIIEWQQETKKNPLIGLSCTKDVQDAILKDPVYRQVIDVIDIRYWWYQADGELYAPKGGQHLAPRQHARLLKPKRSSFDQVYRAVREYRSRYPDKAVLYSADNSFGWAVLMAGGSIPNIPNFTDTNISSAILRMSPQLHANNRPGQYFITDNENNILVYASTVDTIQLDLSNFQGIFNALWFDPGSNEVKLKGDNITANAKVKIGIKYKPCLLWLKKLDSIEEN